MAKKELYDYQKEDLERLMGALKEKPSDYNLLYQLPTGGGKTVIFSEIARRYTAETKKKVMILTHRIELCKQTSNMLNEFGVKNKIINSEVKELPEQDEYDCFVAMVETLNNRLNEEDIIIEGIGLVIIDEAHYNSFRKLFKYFEECFILGVTATPLSSNIKLPMKDTYQELMLGNSIPKLVEKGYLARSTTYNYNVKLGMLKIGSNGDYTVKSSDLLYSNIDMLNKLIAAYEERAKGKKCLIFNSGIATSRQVFEAFDKAGYNAKHLDSTHSKQQRIETIEWFKREPDAILSSVGILTTGFDEPTVETIILNRATKSITLYFQMIGRGSRVLPNKKTFDIIDMGNNSARFGLWDEAMDWQTIFLQPDFYYDNLISDEEIERKFVYEMPEEIRAKFANSIYMDFNVAEENKKALAEGKKSSAVLDLSIEQHANMCVENSEDIFDARILMKLLEDDIQDRIRHYCYCITNSTKNYKAWLLDDYKLKLRRLISKKMKDMAPVDTSE